jgi:hypothetical protein
MRSYLMYQKMNVLFSVIEDYAKKNRNSFLIAVLLTTMIYSH